MENLSCSDLKLTASLDVKINQLCINHDLFEFTVKQGHANWSYQAGVNLTRVEIDTIDIKGLNNLNFKNETNPSNPLKQLHSILKKLSEINIPLDLNIKQFSYQGFNSQSVYTGGFLAENNHYTIHLASPLDTELVSITGNILNNDVNARLSINTQEFVDLLAAHHINLPLALQNRLTVKGKVSSEFFWSDNLLKIKQHSKSVLIESDKGIFKSGPFKLIHNLIWQAYIDEQEISLFFDPKSDVNLSFDHDALIKLLQANIASEFVINLVKNNASDMLIIQPHGSLKVNLENQSIALDELTVEIPKSKGRSLVKFESFTSSFNLTKMNTDFEVDSKIKLLNGVTQAPISINLIGQLDKNTDHLAINILP